MNRLQQAIADLFDPHRTVDEALALHVTPDFRQRTNGEWVDRAGFRMRIEKLRAEMEQVDVTVLDEQAQGEHYAERHVIDLRLRGGARIAMEVYVFARRDAQGRFRCIEEATFPHGGPASGLVG